MGSFYVENFGCRATQADGAAIERQFIERGLERAQSPSRAQVVVLNTCTVTAAADQDARAAIRRIHRENPDCQIVVTGCYAQRAAMEIAALPGVSSVVGNSHKHQLADLAIGPAAAEADYYTADATRLKACPDTGHFSSVSDSEQVVDSGKFVPLSALASGNQRLTSPAPRVNSKKLFVTDIFAHTELLAAPVFDAANERTRPNLKVQDGCDNRCSFCIIPSVRGHSRSLPLYEVIGEVNALVAAGYREVVISGINLGRWGRDLVLSPQSSVVRRTSSAFLATEHGGAGTFVRLLQAILNHTSLEKLRISSVEPMDWTDDLIQLVAESPRIAKHAHVPMQSGSDRVLRAMHRKYRPWHYREKILKIREAMPTAAIGADVMVGFPGETDADFEQTRRMVEELPFTYLHVFTYSARPGTPAAALPNQVPVQIARERNRVLRELASQKKLDFMQSFVGRQVEAITLKDQSPVIPSEGEAAVEGPCVPQIATEALTDNYLKMKLRGVHEPNRWISAQVESVSGGTLIAS